MKSWIFIQIQILLILIIYDNQCKLYLTFQVAFFIAGQDPKIHPFAALDISSPRQTSSTSTCSSTSTPSVDSKQKEPESLRDDGPDDVFGAQEDDKPRPKITSNKRPRISSPDMFLSSSPETPSGIDLTRFFGVEPQPKIAVLQILNILLTSEDTIGEFLFYTFIRK